jgi:hypothetical protein
MIVGNHKGTEAIMRDERKEAVKIQCPALMPAIKKAPVNKTGACIS